MKWQEDWARLFEKMGEKWERRDVLGVVSYEKVSQETKQGRVLIVNWLDEVLEWVAGALKGREECLERLELASWQVG